MRLATVILMISLLQVSAATVAQNLTYAHKKTSITQIIKEIRKQTGLNVMASVDNLKNIPAMDVNFKNTPVADVLNTYLAGQSLTYEMENKLILIKEKPASVLDKIKTALAIPVIVTGKVTDSTGTPIPGATIKVKGANLSTVSNEKGEFSLTVPEKSVLLITSIGFENKEVAIGENKMIIALKHSTSKLDEVKIIGYGTTTQRLTTGSVSKVSGADIESQPVSDPILALQGRVPGLFITQSNGLPGSGFNILIRGKNSISQGTIPLYVIDGVPFDASNPTQAVATGSMNVVNPFNSINPADIESIEVLKDADATSIYGSRGANGVILITTKRPRPGSLNVSLDLRSGWSKVDRSLHLLNGEQYRAMRREAFRNDGIIPDASNAYDLLAVDTTIQNDFNKTLIGGTAPTTNLQFRISGGNNNTQFTAGANYFTEGTVFPGDLSNTRKTLSTSINHTSIDKKFNLLLTSNYSYSQSNLIPVDLTQRLPLPPNGFGLKDASGKLIWSDAANNYGNPLSYTLQRYDGLTDLLNTSALASYKLLPGLSIKANGGYNLLSYNEDILTPIAAQNPAYNLKGNAGFGHNTSRSWSIEPQIQYVTAIKSKGRLEAIVGSSFQQTEGIKDYISGSGYVSDALINTIAGAATIKASNTYNLYHYNAFFGRLTMNWNDAYILNVTGRRDGSSRFGPGNQFANFGSIGAAWIFSQTNFIKNNLPSLSFGKFRASYGTSGNDQIGNYNYLDTYAASTLTYQQALSIQPTRLFNKDYSWEQFTKLEAAVELGFFNDRLYFSVDYYRNRSDNQLISYSLPGQTGFTSVLLNFPGTVENKGWEIEVRSDNLKKDNFKWSTGFNISIPQNRLLRFPGLASSSYSNSFALGQPLSVLFGYQYLGVDPQTGTYKVKDQNNDGIYDDKDFVVIGNTDPQFYGGIQNTLIYKRITFSFLLQFTKQMGRHPIFSNSGLLGSDSNIPQYVLANHWQKPGDVATYAKFTQQYGTELSDSYDLVSNSSAQLTDASYIRLKTASLGYEFPSTLLKAIKIKSLNVYVEGQNLLTFSKYPGPDPEVQSTFILPPLRTITFGVKAGL